MNGRDSVIVIAALGALPPATLAQTGGRMPVIGLLHPGSAGTINGSSSAVEVLLSDLGGLGYFDGKTIRIEYRWAQGRPGGNLTGLFLNHADLAAKWLQQIAEVKPGARQLAVLSDASTGPYQLDAIKAAAKAMAVQLAVLEFKGADGIQHALDAGLKARPGAIVQLGSPLINSASKATAAALSAQRVAAISPYRAFVENGGPLSYGVNLASMNRSLALYIAKILRGARPGELPIDLPTRFELLVNLKTAKAMAIKIPQSLLLRADEVIE